MELENAVTAPTRPNAAGTPDIGRDDSGGGSACDPVGKSIVVCTQPVSPCPAAGGMPVSGRFYAPSSPKRRLLTAPLSTRHDQL